jgi:hypothetical protein
MGECSVIEAVVLPRREIERERAHWPHVAVGCSIDKRVRPEKENKIFNILFN